MREALTALAGALTLPALAATTPAHAATPATPEPAETPGMIASYRGRIIDLSKGWQGAQACAQIRIGDIRCYDSREEMYRASDAVRAAALQTGGLRAQTNCGGWNERVALFSGVDWSGTELALYETVGWINLAAYGFDNEMESWANQKQCNAYLADGTGGSGDRLTLGANASQLNAGAWKNKASSALVYF